MTIRRMKTYTGEQGYVYQYYFVGKRPGDKTEFGATTEYIFDVTADRKTMFAVSIFLPVAVLDTWARLHSRVLTDAEQYAAVKVRLFKAFDEIEDMLADGRHLIVDIDLLQEMLSKLGVA